MRWCHLEDMIHGYGNEAGRYFAYAQTNMLSLWRSSFRLLLG